MTRSSTDALAFIDALSSLAQRLAAKNLVVSKLHCYWRAFGSWELEVQRGSDADAYGAALLNRDYNTPGPQVLLFSWDGKEHVLSVSSAPTEPLTSPGPWKQVLDRPFKDSALAAEFVEAYALKWAAGAVQPR